MLAVCKFVQIRAYRRASVYLYLPILYFRTKSAPAIVANQLAG